MANILIWRDQFINNFTKRTTKCKVTYCNSISQIIFLRSQVAVLSSVQIIFRARAWQKDREQTRLWTSVKANLEAALTSSHNRSGRFHNTLSRLITLSGSVRIVNVTSCVSPNFIMRHSLREWYLNENPF